MKHASNENLFSHHNLEHDVTMFAKHCFLDTAKSNDNNIRLFNSYVDAEHYKCSACRFTNDPNFINH